MSGIQRGMVNFNALPGDQQTPGWASLKGAECIPIEQLKGLPGIPSLPISAHEARKQGTPRLTVRLEGKRSQAVERNKRKFTSAF